MSIFDSRHELETALQTIGFRLAECEKLMQRGDLRSRVRCSGVREVLLAQQAALRRRLAQVKAQPTGLWGTLRAWFHMESALLEEQIDGWTARHDHAGVP